jgi:MFS family permease
LTVSSRIQAQLTYYGGLERQVYLVILAGAAPSICWGLSGVLPGVYLPQIGFSGTQVGALFTVNGLTAAFLVIPLAMWSDRVGRRTGLLSGIVASGLGTLVFAVTTDYSLLLAASFLTGLGGGLTMATSTALIADKTSESKRRVAFSVSFFVDTAAGAMGALVGGLPELLRTGLSMGMVPSYQSAYAVAAALLFTTALLAALVHEERRTTHGFTLPRRSGGMIVRYSVVGIITGFGAGFIIPIFSLWFHTKFGYTEAVLSPLSAVATLLTAVAGLLAPKVADRLGDIRSVLLEDAIATLTLFVMPNTSWFPLLATMFIVRQFLMNMSSPVLTSFYMSHVHPEDRAAASAISGSSWNFPNSVTPELGGYIMQSVSVDLPLYICASTYTVMLVLLFVFFRGYIHEAPSGSKEGDPQSISI